MQISYVDGPRLRRSLVAACLHAQASRGELNRINVFPVPDGDTGTNLSLTVRAIADRLRGFDDPSVDRVAREAAEAAVLGARGNCGMMLSHFLLGFAEGLRGEARARAEVLGHALGAGARNLQAALDEPVEGTILTVVRDAAAAAEEAGTRDIAALVDHVLGRARESLERTPELLPPLKEAGVVDAGAKGFVQLLEGIRLYIAGEAPAAPPGKPAGEEEDPSAAGEAEYPSDGERYRFCTEALARGSELPGDADVRARLRTLGDSLIVIRTGEVLKVHVHTDRPREVFAYLREVGTLVTHKAEDMHAQHRGADRGRGAPKRPVGVVTDSACDLPDEVLRAHGIEVVPLLLVDGDRVLHDRVDITADEFHRRMEAQEVLPTTSQAPPGDFLRGFRSAGRDAREVVGVILSGALSGTYGSAESAARLCDDVPVRLVDSRAASLLQGLLVLRAAELAELATPPDEIAGELARIRDRSGLFFTVDRFDRLLASGRVGKGTAWLGGLLGVKPILRLTPDGRVERDGQVLGRKRVLPAVMRRLEAEIPDDAERVRFGVVHVGWPDVVERVSSALRERWGDVEILTGPATPVISTHIGVGSWAVAYMVEDGA